MARIKIKHIDPKTTDFSTKDIVINVKTGCIFYKNVSNELFKLQGDNVNNTQLINEADTRLVAIPFKMFYQFGTTTASLKQAYIPLIATDTVFPWINSTNVHLFPYGGVVKRITYSYATGDDPDPPGPDTFDGCDDISSIRFDILKRVIDYENLTISNGNGNTYPPSVVNNQYQFDMYGNDDTIDSATHNNIKFGEVRSVDFSNATFDTNNVLAIRVFLNQDIQLTILGTVIMEYYVN